MRISKKALLLCGAFFIACNLANYSHAQCGDPASAQKVEVAYVYDGDTVKLSDGRKIRLIGINTPEEKKDTQPAEFLAREATIELKTLLRGADVSLSLGIEKQDRYKRWLGHLYINGESVAEQLLSAGLAYQIGIPPNVQFADCFKRAEESAAFAGRGLWKISPWQNVKDLKGKESGFRLLIGKISAIKPIRSGWIVEVDDLLAIKVSHEVGQGLSERFEWQKAVGETVRIRGWVKPKSASAPSHYQPWFMNLSYKTDFELSID
jgi:endonuclease YncB( thermonuclease family)